MYRKYPDLVSSPHFLMGDIKIALKLVQIYFLTCLKLVYAFFNRAGPERWNGSAEIVKPEHQMMNLVGNAWLIIVMNIGDNISALSFRHSHFRRSDLDPF